MREQIERVHRIVGERLAQYHEAPLGEPLRAVFRDRLASGDKSIPWFMLPVLTCEALGGEVDLAYHAAAGLEMARVAAGCLDEWQDHDTEDALWQAIGPERAVSLAMGMVALSLLSLTHLADLGAEPRLVLALHREFEVTLLRMSAGQYADLSNDLALDDYENVAGAKTGTLLRLGCRAGAMLARAPAEIVAQYGDFGHQLGILIQVWNDILGLAGVLGKNDVGQRRALPILAAMALDPAGAGAKYQPRSMGGQGGQLYTVLQLGFSYQHASEALARCPAPGGLPQVLAQYDPGRLAGMMGQAQASREGDHERQVV